MQLISSQASPFVRKVHVVLHETGQSQDIEVIEAGTTPINTPDHVRAANPTGKIPALIRPDGPALHDSRVITRFLDARANSGLHPEARLRELLTLESMADAIMDAAVLITYEGRVRPEEQQSDVWKEAQWGKIRAALDVINTRWMSHLAGPLDASHIAVGCALGYLDFRHDARGWRTGVDALAKWNEAFQERESMQATAPA